MTSVELATSTETHEPSMYRLLRALACLGVVTEVEPDRFELAPAGAPLQTNAPDSVRALVLLLCGDEVWGSWGGLEYSVQTGQPAWERVTGMKAFEYLVQHPGTGLRRSTRRWRITPARWRRESSPLATSPGSTRWSTWEEATER